MGEQPSVARGMRDICAACVVELDVEKAYGILIDRRRRRGNLEANGLFLEKLRIEYNLFPAAGLGEVGREHKTPPALLGKVYY
jgi:hypothetical protein